MNPLVKKLKLKPGLRAAVLQPPQGYVDTLEPLPEGSTPDVSLDGMYGWIQVFVRNQDELKAAVPAAVAALKPESLLWICFPKGASGMQTDLTRDRGWDAMKAYELKWINLVSIDEHWSAFSLRPFKPGEEKSSYR